MEQQLLRVVREAAAQPEATASSVLQASRPPGSAPCSRAAFFCDGRGRRPACTPAL